MNLPDFFDTFPALDIPFSEDIVTTRVIRSDHGMAVFFDAKQDFEVPAHSHLGQCGTVLSGRIDLTIDGTTTTYIPGQFYEIGAGTVHAAKVFAGSKVMDIFEEPDRYPLKAE